MHRDDRDALTRLLEFLQRPDVDDHRGRLMARMMIVTVLNRKHRREPVTLRDALKRRIRQMERARRRAGLPT